MVQVTLMRADLAARIRADDASLGQRGTIVSWGDEMEVPSDSQTPMLPSDIAYRRGSIVTRFATWPPQH
jgi:hypothetical protein